MKKNNLFLALIVVITSSCASLQHNKLVPMDALVAKNNQQTTTILTKDSVIIPNVYITKLKNDTVYYKKVDPQSYAKRMKFTSDSLYSIYAGETLAGLNYNHKKLAKFDSLPWPIRGLQITGGGYLMPLGSAIQPLLKDTRIDIQNSLLIGRGQQDQSYILHQANGELNILAYENLESFLKNNCTEAYEQYMKGKKLSNIGLGLLVGGLGVAECGLLGTMICGILYGKKHNTGLLCGTLTSYGVMILGTITCLSSIGVIKTGRKNIAEAVNIYNIQAQSKEPNLSLNTHVNNNGIGLSLQF